MVWFRSPLHTPIPMNNHRKPNLALRPGKSRMMEILVGAAVLVIALGIGSTMISSGQIKRNKADALKKLNKMVS